MIDAKGLTKYYGALAAVENVTFSVAKGEIIGFLGPNAAGKTTTMRILTGFSPATRGRAVIDGFDIDVDPIEVKRRVGYLPESVPLYGDMLVSGFLSYVAEVKGIPWGQRKSEVGRVMEHCGLTRMAKRILRNLSKGYRQRVGLAQALIGNPPVLILDEPTVGLDPAQIVEIRQMIKDLGQEHTVLLSTHILPEVTMVCERVIIINRGRIVAEDTLENLAGCGRPVTEFEVDAPCEQVAAAMERVPDVASFSEIGQGRYRAESASGVELGANISHVLAQTGLPLRTLVRRTRTLEDVFLAAIASDEGARQ